MRAATPGWLRAACAVPGLSWAPPALAGYGVYTHGYGIKSLGYAGMGFILAEDSYTLASNPAGATVMGSRADYGVDYENFDVSVGYENNLLGSNERHLSRQHDFVIPQLGFVREVSDRLAVGATAFFAGVGTDYKDSPYRRFGSAPRASVGIGQVGASLALGYLLTPAQSIGFSANLSYQELEVKGLDVFTFGLLSSDRDHLSNQGKDGRPGIGFTVGWLGALGPQLNAALSYRSKTWSQKFDEYRGLFPDRGRVDLPSIYGGGLAWEFLPGWSAAFEYQRITYAEEAATGNGFTAVIGGGQLGTRDGPGFGWDNQNVYKFGLSHQATERLILRAGYADATRNIPASQTFFGALAPSFLGGHYTLGATWIFTQGWEVSSYAALAPEENLYGEGSIPPLLGGGEANLRSRQFFGGLSFGRRFGE